MFSCT